MEGCRGAHIGVAELVEEVLAVHFVPNLSQGQAADDWHQHKANAEILQGSMQGCRGSKCLAVCFNQALHTPSNEASANAKQVAKAVAGLRSEARA